MNGRVRADLVIVNGQEERHPEGAYYLEWWEGAKRIRLSVGKDAAEASARRLQKEAELNAVNHGVVVTPQNGNGNGPRSLSLTVQEFLDETKLTKKPKTYAAYSTALKYFQESCPKMYLADISRQDLLKFSAFLRDVKKQSPRSVYNKFEIIMTFLKAQGVRGLVGKNDWPRFVEQEPEVYEREELEKLFAVCDEEERLWYEFFLMTGMREQEVMHCSWADVNLTRSTVTVRYKPEYGFSPKNYREREIPIPAKLVTSLKAWKAKADKFCGLVFATAGCSPKLNFLDDLKVVVERANLDKEANSFSSSSRS
jgi:integrase/recombinase XerD